MIGYLTGKVKINNAEQTIIDVQGVGYLVTITPHLKQKLQIDQSLELFIYTHVREDTLELYGLESAEEYRLFKLLLSVSGIGAKTAILIIDQGVGPIMNAISQAKVEFFTAIPKLGTKNSQKIIIELKNKVGGITDLDLSDNNLHQEVIDALSSMGYTKSELSKILKTMPAEHQTLESQIRYSLQQLNKG